MRNLFLCVFLTACSAAPLAPVENPVPVGMDDSCDAAQYASVVGQDATALERVLILGQVRIVRPGSVLTQDYRPERINFIIGADNSIRQITCG